MVASAKTDLSTRFQSWLGGSEPAQIGGNRLGCGTARSAVPLPCLNSNNCTAHEGKPYGNGRKTAFALERNVEAFLEKTGIERVGFLTLTFAEHIVDRKEAQ